MVNWDGSRYRQVSSLQQWLAERAAAGFTLRAVNRLLDIGCGDGRITAAIADHIPDATVIGVDPSPRMIAVAPSGPNLSFRLGDVNTLQFSAEFDAIVSFNALHWVPDQFGALVRIATALTPGGSALLVFVCAGDRPSLEDVAMEVVASQRWRSQFVDFEAPFVHPDVVEWEAMAWSAGLEVRERDVQDLSWDFGTRASFAEWCTVGFGAWTDRLDRGDAGAFVDDVVTAYGRATGSESVFRFMQLRAMLHKPIAR